MSPFPSPGATLVPCGNCAYMPLAPPVCQVTPRAVRLFDGPTPIQDLPLEELLVLGPAPPSGLAQGSTTIMWAQVREQQAGASWVGANSHPV
jgi:hypothetical protein